MSAKQRIVFLDRSTIAPQIRLRPPSFEHEMVEHQNTSADQVVPRLDSATVAILNKVPISVAVLEQLPRLKLIAVAATAMLAVGSGALQAQQRMPLGPLRLAAAGVLLALASGLPAWAVDSAYMTHLWASVPLGFTELKVSTVMLFDLGVYLAVWGALGGLCAQVVSLDESRRDEDAGSAAERDA